MGKTFVKNKDEFLKLKKIQDARLDKTVEKIKDQKVVSKRIKTSFIVEKIIDFCEFLADTKMYKYQRVPSLTIVEYVLEKRPEVVTELFSRQAGKSWGVSMLVSGLMVILPVLANQAEFKDDPRFNYVFKDPEGNEKYVGFKSGFWVGIFAPISDQSLLTYNKIRGILLSDTAEDILSDRDIRVKFSCNNGNQIVMTSGSKVTSKSASDTSKIEGDTLHLAIVEEAQLVSNFKLNKEISPMLASTAGLMVKIGTAFNFKGHFLESINSNKKMELTTGIKNHFEYNYKYTQKYNPLYKNYVDSEKRRLGENSDEFQMNFALKWLLERGMFITEEDNERMQDSTHSLVWNKNYGKQIAGIDIGKMNDSTVVTILDCDNQDSEGNFHKTILGWLELYGDDYESQWYQIVEFLNAYQGLEMIAIDANGVGDPVADRFIANYEPYIKVLPVVPSPPTKNVMFKSLSIEIRAGRISYPYDEEAKKSMVVKKFEQQMVDAEKEFRRGFLNVSHPDDKNAHDDFCFSLALANYATTTEEELPEIQFGDRIKFVGSNNNFSLTPKKRISKRRRYA